MRDIRYVISVACLTAVLLCAVQPDPDRTDGEPHEKGDHRNKGRFDDDQIKSPAL